MQGSRKERIVVRSRTPLPVGMHLVCVQLGAMVTAPQGGGKRENVDNETSEKLPQQQKSILTTRTLFLGVCPTRSACSQAPFIQWAFSKLFLSCSPGRTRWGPVSLTSSCNGAKQRWESPDTGRAALGVEWKGPRGNRFPSPTSNANIPWGGWDPGTSTGGSTPHIKYTASHHPEPAAPDLG